MAHRRDEGGAADLGQAGQRAGQGAGVGPAVGGLPLGGVGGELGLGGPQQADLGGDLGGQVDEGHRPVAGVELDGGAGGVEPLVKAGARRLTSVIAKASNNHQGARRAEHKRRIRDLVTTDPARDGPIPAGPLEAAGPVDHRCSRNWSVPGGPKWARIWNSPRRPRRWLVLRVRLGVFP